MSDARRGRENKYEWIQRLSKRLQLDGDQWHDGRLVELSFRTSRRGARTPADVTLRVDVFGDATHARTRTPLTITFGDVQELVTTVNVAELTGGADDQIVFARLNDTSKTLDLSVHLAGGYVRVVAGRCAVSSAKSKR